MVGRYAKVSVLAYHAVAGAVAVASIRYNRRLITVHHVIYGNHGMYYVWCLLGEMEQSAERVMLPMRLQQREVVSVWGGPFCEGLFARDNPLVRAIVAKVRNEIPVA